MAIKILFPLAVAALLASSITGRTLPVERTLADMHMTFFHHQFPPYGGIRGGMGPGFGRRPGSGVLGGGLGSGSSFAGGAGGSNTGTGGVGGLESGAASNTGSGSSSPVGGRANGDGVEGGLKP